MHEEYRLNDEMRGIYRLTSYYRTWVSRTPVPTLEKLGVLAMSVTQVKYENVSEAVIVDDPAVDESNLY